MHLIWLSVSIFFLGCIGALFDDSTTPYYSQVVYVQSATPYDVSDGSQDRPYTSISTALTSITDNSPSKRYVIQVGPGSYTESETVHLKPNVFIKGISKNAVRLNFNWDLNETGWYNPSASTDDRSGFESVSLVGSSNVANFSTQSSGAGKLTLFDVRVNNGVTVVAYSTITQLVIQDSQLFSSLDIYGTNTLFNGVYFVNAGNVTFRSSANSPTYLQALGGAITGSLQVIYGGGDQLMQIELQNFAVFGSLSASGALATIVSNKAAMPNFADISLTGGATLSVYNP